jgi:ribonuclease P protein component
MTGSASPTFSKRERIVSRTLIEKLFSKDSSQTSSAFPLRAVYMGGERKEGEEPVQVLISVSKRHFKHAVKRNRVKRQIRESYRHHKQILVEKIPEGQSLYVAFIWLADELYDSQQVEKSLRKLLEKVAQNI